MYCKLAQLFVVARVIIRLNCIDTDAYAQCFKAIFDAVSKDHPMFKIGVSLNGILADWCPIIWQTIPIAVVDMIIKLIHSPIDEIKIENMTM